jgi:hypothetical protein
MKRLLLLCLTAAVLVSCLGLSAQAAPTLSWTEFYTMGDAASAHTRIDPIELDGTTTLFLPASVSRKAVPVYFTLSEKNAYDELLRTVEGWAANARQAMNTIAYEEVEIHG